MRKIACRFCHLSYTPPSKKRGDSRADSFCFGGITPGLPFLERWRSEEGLPRGEQAERHGRAASSCR